LLGQKLVSLLAPKKEITVIATARGESRLMPGYGSFLYESMDITNREDVLNVVGRYRPDAIINTAAMTNVDECEKEKEACMQLNVEAVRYLIEASALTDTFLRHLSNDFIFSGQEGPYDEEGIPAPVNFYGESKLLGEQLVMDSNSKW